jgi:sulfite exporter TauE/SafE
VPETFAINFFGAFSSTFAAIVFLFFITRREYLPHNRFQEEIKEFNWDRKRTPFLLGLLAGYPPCIFELFIYSQCFTWSLSYGFGQGILTVFYFSLGTFIGLFLLALAKQGTSKLLGDLTESSKRDKLYYLMLLIIIIFNIIIMILSFFRIDIYSVTKI